MYITTYIKFCVCYLQLQASVVVWLRSSVPGWPADTILYSLFMSCCCKKIFPHFDQLLFCCFVVVVIAFLLLTVFLFLCFKNIR